MMPQNRVLRTERWKRSDVYTTDNGLAIRGFAALKIKGTEAAIT